MRVTATERGFCQKIREPGDTFTIKPDQFSPEWMKKAGEQPAEPKQGEPTATTETDKSEASADPTATDEAGNDAGDKAEKPEKAASAKPKKAKK